MACTLLSTRNITFNVSGSIFANSTPLISGNLMLMKAMSMCEFLMTFIASMALVQQSVRLINGIFSKYFLIFAAVLLSFSIKIQFSIIQICLGCYVIFSLLCNI